MPELQNIDFFLRKIGLHEKKKKTVWPPLDPLVPALPHFNFKILSVMGAGLSEIFVDVDLGRD